MSESEQGFISHIIELRSRLLRSAAVVLLVFLALFAFANDIYAFVATPLLNAMPEGSQMIATEVASPFLTPFKLAFVAAIFISMPYLLLQLWRFIAPGLFQHEKRIVLPVLFFSVALFYAGIVFAYYAVFPVMFAFFSSVGPFGVSYTPDIARFLDTVLKLFFAFGLAFEIPIITVVLAFLGVTTAAALRKKRAYIIILCFIAGALLTPPDPVSQCLMAIPMWLLFELGVVFAQIIERRSPLSQDLQQEEQHEH